MEELLKVGIITSTHGVRGEVKVFPTTDDVKRFGKLKNVMLDTEQEMKVMEIEGVKYFKQFAILKFKGYDSINDIEKYKGKNLFVHREEAVKLEEGEYFVADLIGMKVRNEDDSFRGCIKDVFETGANDVYVIETVDKKEVLLPAIKECILDVNISDNTMLVHIMDGLI